MQTAKVDSEGTQFAYIDSGPLHGDSYTTLVCIHGHSFTAQNFSRLLPLAQKYNLRIIAPNRRDYIGSTLFSEDELSVLNGNNDLAHKAFLRDRGLEIAHFLKWIIDEMKIPLASEDGKAGGLALMGWSLGNTTTVAFLRYLKTYPSELVTALEPYIRTFFIYEAPDVALGVPTLEGCDSPLTDPEVPEHLRGIQFGTWVSSYYHHPIYASPPTGSIKESRTVINLQVRTPTAPRRPATMHTFSPEEMLTCLDPAPGPRSEEAFISIIHPSTIYEQTSVSLHWNPDLSIESGVPDRESANLSLPDLKIEVIYGHESIWNVQWAVWEIEKDIEKWSAEGRAIRPVKFTAVRTANHFLHWDEPDEFMRVFAEAIRL